MASLTEMLRQANQLPNDGFARRFEHRPEFALKGVLLPEVYDASGIPQRPSADLLVFNIKDLFAADDEIFLGFGKPNTYLVVPDGVGGYQKFHGKSLRRAPSVIEDTKGRVQSGLIIRLKNLPPKAASALRLAMQKYHGRKFWTCVNACMHVMQEAGFSTHGKALNKRYYPYSLFHHLANVGLTYDGKPVEMQLIRTVPTFLQRFGFNIVKAEATTICRHATRSMSERKKKGLKRHLPAMLQRAEPVVAPELPDCCFESDISVRVSKASRFGSFMRLLWGPHALFEGKQTRVKIGDYLPDVLEAFPKRKGQKQSLATKAKKYVLFSRPVIWLIRRLLVRDYLYIGLKSERDIYNMMRTDSEGEPNKYNLVLAGQKIIIFRISVGLKIADWILSKHVLGSGYAPDVGFAGEIWKDPDGVFHITGNSGTYQPSPEQVAAACAYMQAVFPNLKVVAG